MRYCFELKTLRVPNSRAKKAASEFPLTNDALAEKHLSSEETLRSSLFVWQSTREGRLCWLASRVCLTVKAMGCLRKNKFINYDRLINWTNLFVSKIQIRVSNLLMLRRFRIQAIKRFFRASGYTPVGKTLADDACSLQLSLITTETTARQNICAFPN